MTFAAASAQKTGTRAGGPSPPRLRYTRAMEWNDDGIVLSVRRHGETAAIVSLLTRDRGRHAGLVRGGAGRRARGMLQPGNRVAAVWRARLPEHLGTLTCELTEPVAAAFLGDRGRLAGLSAVCAILDGSLPEREPHPRVFAATAALLAAFAGTAAWPSAYVKWELGLLAEMGFGLDLGTCAATGRNDQLAYVSPRTGRAVSLAAGEPYRERLFSLPPFLLADGEAGDVRQVAAGAALTGHFLDQHVFAPRARPLPAARRRLADLLASDATD